MTSTSRFFHSRRNIAIVASASVIVLAGLAWLAFGYFGVQTLFIDDEVSESAPVFDAEPAAVIAPTPTTAAPAPSDPASAAPVTTEPVTTEPVTTEPSDSAPAATANAEPAPQPEPTTAPLTTAEAPTPEIATEYSGTFQSDAHPTSGQAIVLGNGTGQRFLRFEDFETDNGPDLNVYLVNSSTGDVSDYVDLGDLKGNIGEQNYEIPADVDLDVYDEVVIWCVRFSVGFGDATLAGA